MGGNDEGIGDTGVRYIVEGMCENTGVVKLELSLCSIGVDGGTLLSTMLCKNRSLRCLNLRSNSNMGDDGINELSKHVEKWRLEELCIRGCHYSFEGLKKFIQHLII